jgi:hypothetical protein
MAHSAAAAKVGFGHAGRTVTVTAAGEYFDVHDGEVLLTPRRQHDQQAHHKT